MMAPVEHFVCLKSVVQLPHIVMLMHALVFSQLVNKWAR